jgi:hypothetical protein
MGANNGSPPLRRAPSFSAIDSYRDSQAGIAASARVLAGVLAHRARVFDAPGVAAAAAARTQEALEQAIAQALVQITAADTHGWFAHCRYPVEARWFRPPYVACVS